MLIWAREHRCILVLTLLGSVVGALSGFWLAHAVLLRAAETSLSAYASELTRNTDDMADEIESILTDYPRGIPACSDQDLTVLKLRTFRSRRVKDIGRTHDGKLFCSAFLGRLAHPFIKGTPSLVLAGGTKLYINISVALTSEVDGRGTVVERNDVGVLLNASAFGNWDRPPLGYMVDAINSDTGQMAQIAGSKLAIDPALVVSRRSQRVRGNVYSSVCSDRHPVCAVTTERIADVWSSTRSTQIAYTAMGAFAGLSLGLAAALFFRRTKSLSYQLLHAVRRHSPSLSLVYQPIVDMGTGQCMGAEALLRWTDQNGVSIHPDLFISMAEESGFINEITAFVVMNATRDLGDLLRSCEDFTLSLNIAASDMADDKFFELLRVYVSEAGIRPSQIALELTERSTAHLTLVSAAIQRLRDQHYKVHIDDFGIGFSSLSYIDQLNVNAIKIDRAFSRTIGTDAIIAPVLSQMLAMATSLGVEVVVEGVETRSQRDYLAAKGMTLRGQGWFFSKPLTLEALQLFNAQSRTTEYCTVVDSYSMQHVLGNASEPDLPFPQ